MLCPTLQPKQVFNSTTSQPTCPPARAVPGGSTDSRIWLGYRYVKSRRVTACISNTHHMALCHVGRSPWPAACTWADVQDDVTSDTSSGSSSVQFNHDYLCCYCSVQTAVQTLIPPSEYCGNDSSSTREIPGNADSRRNSGGGGGG
jgi:hypothetical protein